MTESDIEALKRPIPKGIHVLQGTAVILTVPQAVVLIAALEDRDRLRAALKNWHRPHFPGTGLCVCANCEELAALEGHDG